MKALLQSILDQLDDRIAGLRDCTPPVKVEARRGDENAQWAALDEAKRKHASAEEYREHDLDRASMWQECAYASVTYWPSLDALCDLRRRVKRYVDQVAE